MLRLMLNEHPEIAFHHEFDFAIIHLPRVGFPDMENYRHALPHDRIFVDSRFDVDPSLDYAIL
jgi:hypothetical protein